MTQEGAKPTPRCRIGQAVKGRTLRASLPPKRSTHQRKLAAQRTLDKSVSKFENPKKLKLFSLI
jgi:hypothetical protein